MKSILLAFLLIVNVLHGEQISWEKPVIIGASLSDGFHLRGRGIPFASRRSKGLGLHHHLKSSLTASHGPILNLGSNWFFLATEAKGKYQVNRARKVKATVVFAIHYLFWYLSAEPRQRGREFRDLSRLEFFEKGLAHLATLKCPVVVGNIPDARSSVGKVLKEKQYAGAETIAKANARLVVWLKDHPNIALMDLHRFHQLASTDQEMEVVGQTIPEGQTRKLYLQWDQLHPTPTGASSIAKVALDVLEKHQKD
ncbi:MAG: hypothetical protein ACJA1W_002905 [Akkermansiaceae bacterium]|jgi:hypothetical protein